MKLLSRFAFLCLALALPARAAAPVDPYDVVWTSPSADHHGTMPLGNGDLALNAWMTRGGDLQFYLSKTDAWDDNARLVKVGKVRVHFEPNPITPQSKFRQELKLEQGCVEITIADGGQTNLPPTTTIRLWVDANHPVVQMTAESATPLEATATVELWRTNQQELAEVQCSDVMNHPGKPNSKHAPTILEPDTLLTAQKDRIGWFHYNKKSVGPAMLAEVQGLTGFALVDPLLHRTFGGMLTAAKGEQLPGLRLRSPRGTSHRFSVYVLTEHPSSPDAWQAKMNEIIRTVEAMPFEARWAAHQGWWREFWERSWIRASADPSATPIASTLVPGNRHAVRLGLDQGGGNRFGGELGRVSLFSKALSEAEVVGLAAQPQDRGLPQDAAVLFTGAKLQPQVLSNSTAWGFPRGLAAEAWFKPRAGTTESGRLVDKITPGGSDGFLLDTHPGNRLRFICGQTILQTSDPLPAGQWTHVAAVADPVGGACRLYVNGKLAAEGQAEGGADDPAYVSQMYHLQRFITACAGRGAYPIKFNGSLFTVPPGATEADPDYRRWGPGYWWQNTRLPYISLSTSGDFDLQRPLFHMYAEELLPLAKYRTQHYLGHGGAFYPECIMFWGAMFSETYGWTPFAQRKDKLQESGWHRWEWVGGLELCWMMLDYYDHTLDRKFLTQTAVPFTHEILTFFMEQYPTNAAGKLVMHPSQALETWWNCTNAMPELAGCTALIDRLLALPADAVSGPDRWLAWKLRERLPAIPVREVNGHTALAPAEFFAQKSNIENPELYAVFPFRLFAFNRPHADWALTALENRWDRGHSGWRQDDVFMAYLGQTEDAAKAILSRARSHDHNERFPAFWGPNYDWTPDQDHGGILMKALQAMLLQSDGQKLFLLPSWPKHWNVEFKLHGPQATVIEGVYRQGKIASLQVTPDSRRGDLEIVKR